MGASRCRDRFAPLLHMQDGNGFISGCRSDDDASARYARTVRGRRIGNALHHQRKHLRPRRHAGRKSGRPDPGQHPPCPPTNAIHAQAGRAGMNVPCTKNGSTKRRKVGVGLVAHPAARPTNTCTGSPRMTSNVCFQMGLVAQMGKSGTGHEHMHGATANRLGTFR